MSHFLNEVNISNITHANTLEFMIYYNSILNIFNRSLLSDFIQAKELDITQALEILNILFMKTLIFDSPPRAFNQNKCHH